MNPGQHAETQARTYLEQQGLQFVTQNQRYRFGEIDLIMRDNQYWVFIEVKYRSSTQFGGALHAVSTAQISRIRKAAEQYLQTHKINAPCRFDVIAINGADIQWLQGCF
ncbi:YraN family protein [Shewanella sp. MMG014]|uniref:YraN family protein n=1 Tax=unclassified Shewanella TaxID=196818 RepID=UPI0012E7710F|nr:YraN family protein [Shewanella sp. UCD-FRSSP16_17]MBQ4891406.1 YraN family protein [Shewanella sp. MMG014]